MAYTLAKPFLEEERNNFIIEYNHQKGLRVEETNKALVALEANEILVENEFGELIPEPDPEYDLKQAEIENLKLQKLSLTKRELFLCLYKALGITPEVIRSKILSDQEALIEFDYAEKYYRGNPLIDVLGAQLGLDKETIDNIFKSGGDPAVIRINEGGEAVDA